ncbi:MAG: ribosome maturation factor RimP [Lachnospiraceae bacterium]|nr:ribosome maturation factor RimP [Lachnospiraceae bacterium]
MAKKDVESKCEALVIPIVEYYGFELVDVEYVKEGSNWYLRVYIDKDQGIDIDDCVNVSRELEAKLDEDDFIKDAYILEVSSPGLTRPLKKDKDYLRNIGKRVEVKLYNSVDSLKEFEAELVSYDDGKVTLKLDDEETNREFTTKDFAMIRLAFV